MNQFHPNLFIFLGSQNDRNFHIAICNLTVPFFNSNAFLSSEPFPISMNNSANIALKLQLLVIAIF